MRAAHADVGWTLLCQGFFLFLFARGQSLINDTLCPMMHWACVSICHRGNIGTNLSSGEGESFNPADEKRKCPEKDGHASGETGEVG